MIAYFLERPYLILIFILLIVLTLWVCLKAGQASARHRAEAEKTMKKLKEETELKNEFAVLTPDLAKSANPARLFKGVALNLYKRVANQNDMTAEFEKLSDEQKEVYSLYFVIDDGSERLSDFFEANGQPVTGFAKSLLSKIADGRVYEIFEKEYLAFDREDETTSFIPEEIKALNKEFSEINPYDEICVSAGKFISDNIYRFI